MKYNALKGFIQTIFGISIFVILGGCGESTTTNKIEPPSPSLKIGAMLPLTGDNASYGVDCRKGMELALEEYNASHPSKASIIFEDTKADPKTAVTSINKLLSVDKVNLILGDMFSNSTLAVAPIAQQNNVVLITPTASLVDIVNVGDHIFSIYPSDSYEGALDAKVTLQNGANSVAVFQQQLQVFDAMSKSFVDAIKVAGKQVSYQEIFPSDTKDFRSLIQKNIKNKVDYVYIAAYKKEAYVLIKQLKEAGISSKIISQSTLYDQDTMSVLGNASEGIVLSAPFFNDLSDSKNIQKFRGEYSKKFGGQPNIWAAYGYDVTNLALIADEQAKKNSAPLNVSLASIHFDGITGPMTFNPNRSANKTMQIFKIENGTFKKL